MRVRVRGSDVCMHGYKNACACAWIYKCVCVCVYMHIYLIILGDLSMNLLACDIRKNFLKRKRKFCGNELNSNYIYLYLYITS